MHPGYGYHFHPHKEVEILTFILEGEPTYTVKGQGGGCMRRGDFTYLTAGSGIEHSEFNWGDVPMRMIQVWMKPQHKNLHPHVQYATFNENCHLNQWYLMASDAKNNPIQLQQNVQIWVLKQEGNKKTEFLVAKNQQAYLVQLEGSSTINGECLSRYDGLEVYGEKIQIMTEREACFLLVVTPLSIGTELNEK